MNRRMALAAALIAVTVPIVSACGTTDESPSPAPTSEVSTESPTESETAVPGADPGSAGSADGEPTPATTANNMEGTDIDGEPIVEMETDQNAQALASQILAAQMMVNEAIVMIEDAGYEARIVEINGEPQAVTMDFRPDRFNLTIAGPEGVELVTDITFG